MRKKRVRGLTWAMVAALLAAMAGGVASPQPARGGPTPPTLVVNRTEDAIGTGSLTDGVCDSSLGAGQCTLRAAVMEANHYPGGGVTIVLPAGTYPLTIVPVGGFTESEGSLDFASRLSIVGAGASVTVIDASGLDRVLCVRIGAAATVSGVTMRNGRRVASSLPGTCVYANTGGGIQVEVGSSLSLLASVVADNVADIDAGIENFGHLWFDSGAIIGNRALYTGSVLSAGGLSNHGTLTLTNSTVSNNFGVVSVGGVLNIGKADLRNTTVAGNLVASPAVGAGGVPTGGIAVSGSGALTTSSSLVAYNFVREVPNDCVGTLTSRGYNLVQAVPAACTVAGDATGNLLGLDPLLRALADNGGGTPTRALPAGSPALDAIPPGANGCGTTLTVDQRGAPRPQGTGCEIGAYEGGLPAPLFGRNLVDNGDAEGSAGSPDVGRAGFPRWTVTAGNFTVVRYGAAGGFPTATDPGPPDRGANLLAGGPGGGIGFPDVAIAEQVIDLTPIAGSIDTGRVTWAISAHLGGYAAQADYGLIDMVFHDAVGGYLGQAVVTGPGPTERGGATGLLPVGGAGMVPVGTRSIQFILNANRVGGASGQYNDAYFDNLSLVLTPPPVLFLANVRR
jgi:hypothetical protein